MNAPERCDECSKDDGGHWGFCTQGAWERGYADAVDEAAKLFEGPGSGLSSWHAPEAAARIRRLLEPKEGA